jgi:hypothetical protein
MTNTVIFLVDDTSKEKEFGWTINIDKVLHNIERLPKEWRLKEFKTNLETSDNGLTYFMVAGRYLIFLAITKSKDRGSMIFFDTRNDDDFAIDLSMYFEKKHFQTEFIKQHFLNKPFYSDNYNLAELSTENFLFN